MPGGVTKGFTISTTVLNMVWGFMCMMEEKNEKLH